MHRAQEVQRTTWPAMSRCMSASVALMSWSRCASFCRASSAAALSALAACSFLVRYATCRCATPTQQLQRLQGDMEYSKASRASYD